MTENVAAGVAIIGGGTAGCSTALHLRGRGVTVILLERGACGGQASGGDGSFGEGNEVAIAYRIVMTQHDPSVFRLIPVRQLASDRYRLWVSGSAPLAVADLDAVAIDGDADGKAGTDFVAEFSAGPQR